MVKPSNPSANYNILYIHATIYETLFHWCRNKKVPITSLKLYVFFRILIAFIAKMQTLVNTSKNYFSMIMKLTTSVTSKGFDITISLLSRMFPKFSTHLLHFLLVKRMYLQRFLRRISYGGGCTTLYCSHFRYYKIL